MRPCTMTVHIYYVPAAKDAQLSRLWICFILFLDFQKHGLCLCETLFGHTYTLKQSLNGKTCRPEHVELSFDTTSEISCVFHCASRFNSTGIFHNWANNTCKCCSMLYTSTDEAPTEAKTDYYTYGQAIYKDCVHAQTDGVHTSSVQRVRTPLTNITIEVYCDMDTHDGGWLVFQNRFDGSINFRRNFTAYDDGFGDVRGEYWLGLKYLSEFTSLNPSLVYLMFVDVNDDVVFELFDGFYLRSGPGYNFRIGSFLDANDGTSPPDKAKSFATTANRCFSTEDVDNDSDPSMECAKVFQGGWWFRKCATMNPNGPYAKPGTRTERNAFHHKIWKDLEALKASRLMIKNSANDK